MTKAEKIKYEKLESDFKILKDNFIAELGQRKYDKIMRNTIDYNERYRELRLQSLYMELDTIVTKCSMKAQKAIQEVLNEYQDEICRINKNIYELTEIER
jgi:hypothetical protein